MYSAACQIVRNFERQAAGWFVTLSRLHEPEVIEVTRTEVPHDSTQNQPFRQRWSLSPMPTVIAVGTVVSQDEVFLWTEGPFGDRLIALTTRNEWINRHTRGLAHPIDSAR